MLGTVDTSRLDAQRPTPLFAPLSRVTPWALTAHSSDENTLLALNLLHPRARLTTVRPFGPRQNALLDSLTARPDHEADAPVRWSSPWAAVFANSGEANLQADGAIWQGRGVTAAAGAGITGKLGFVRGALQPLAFASQNLSYSPITGDSTVIGDFGYPVNGGGMDMPYRFGPDMYARVDPGESWIRADIKSLGLGITTASQHWGPATHYPLVMGASAPGYARAFLECFCSLPGVIAKLHWSVGKLESSGYEVTTLGARTASALAVALSPSFLPGLEVGATRFFHVLSDSVRGWDAAVLPFAGFVKQGDPTSEDETGQQNQLLSVFARIAPPGARAELYGEFLREDHNSNWRDFAVEPDHVSAFMIGFRKAFTSGDSSIRLITIEGANARISHLTRLRSQSPMYRHTHLPHGHTHRGQPLGSYQIPGGGGMTIRLDAVHANAASFLAFEVRRTVQTDEGGRWGDRNLAAVALTAGAVRQSRTMELQWSLGAHRHLQSRLIGNLSLEIGVRRLSASGTP